MEKINSEIIISSLFKVGFDKVDTVLYASILKRVKDDKFRFEFEIEDHSEIFEKYVDYYVVYGNTVYKLKKGLTLDTMVSLDNEHYYPLKRILNSNNTLVNYLIKLNYSLIVLRKIEGLSMEVGNLDELKKLKRLFSNKEKEIIYNMFGMDKMLKEKRDSQSKTYHDLYNQECEDLVLLTKGLQRFKK